MALPLRTPLRITTKESIHRPGYGPDDSLCPPAETTREVGGFLLSWPTGEVTYIPDSNIKDVLWGVEQTTKIIPVKKKIPAKPA